MVLTACVDGSPTAPAPSASESALLVSVRKPVHDIFTQPFANEFDCGSFTGLSSGEFAERSTIFFDRSGNPQRLQFHFQYRAIITNLTSGKTLADNAAYNGRIDFVTGQLVVNGKVYNVKDRENGFRIKDIGRIVFDAEGNITFKAGQHDVDGLGDAAPLYCAALA